MYIDILSNLAIWCFRTYLNYIRRRDAEKRKENGNQLYNEKQYSHALHAYTTAIKLCPHIGEYYSNRAACYIMLSKFEEALRDAKKSIELVPDSINGYMRLIKCSFALGDLTEFKRAVQIANALQPKNKTIDSEVKSLESIKKFETEAAIASQRKNYHKVIYYMDKCLSHFQSVTYKLEKAECLVFLGNYTESREIANEILRSDGTNEGALYIKALVTYYSDGSLNILSSFIKSHDHHIKAMQIYKCAKLIQKKKDEGNRVYKQGNYHLAIELYTEALSMDHLTKNIAANLYFNRATSFYKLNKIEETIENCTEALNLKESYIKVLLLRGKCYMDLEQYADAIADFEKACETDKSQESKKCLQEAKEALERPNKNYYEILDVKMTATENEIKKAYRQKSLNHHPDKHVNDSERVKRMHEKIFKKVREAHDTLINPLLRAQYNFTLRA